MAAEQDALLEAAKCYTCLSQENHATIQTYITAYAAGLDTNPSSLAEQAKCFCKMSQEQLEASRIYLTSLIGNLTLNPAAILDAAACYRCIPQGRQDAIVTYLLANDPNGPGITDPGELLEAAKCLRCLSARQKLQVEVYSLGLLAGVTDPGIIGPNLPPIIPITRPGGPHNPRIHVIKDVEDGGGIRGGACVDVLAHLVPEITGITYAAGVASTIDILFPRVCCQILSFTIYESDNADMSGATDLAVLPMTGALPHENNFTISGADVSGATKAYIAVKQNCLDGTVSAYSNIEPRGEPICAAGSVVAEDWADRVEANGGARPSQATIDAAADFYCDLVAAGIDGKMLAVNILAPDNLIAATTPLIAAAGSDPWVNSNFVLADLTVNGLKGNGLNKVLATGVVPNASLSETDTGLTAYCYEAPAGGTESYLGAKNLGNTTQGDLLVSGGTVYFDTWNFTTGRISVASQGAGYYSGNRIAPNSTDLYFAKGATPHSSVVHGATSGGSRPDLQLVAFALTDNTGFPIFFTSTRLSFLAIHSGLTTAESSDFFDAIQALRTTLGGGFV